MILATRLCPPYAVLFKLEFHLAAKPSHFSCSKTQRTRQCARKREARMALGLSDVRCDPVANRALEELMHHYTVAEEKGWLVLTKKAGDMQLFLHDLDDLHQLDFIHNRQMVKETERFRALLTTIGQQRESWKARALMAEAQLLEATAKAGNDASTRTTPPETASRRSFATSSSRKSGTRSSASIKEAPASRDQLRRPDRFRCAAAPYELRNLAPCGDDA
jgi:hypothetical protein